MYVMMGNILSRLGLFVTGIALKIFKILHF